MAEATKFPREYEALKALVREKLVEKENPGRIDNWTHIKGGAETGSSWRRSIAAYESLGFNQVTISDANLDEIDLSCDFFGAKLALPIGVGPMSSGIDFVCENAFVEMAKGCRAAGIAASVGYPSGPSVPGKMIKEYPYSFKVIKPLRDLERLKAEVKAVEEAGCFLTGVDTDSAAALKPAGDTPHFPELGRVLSVKELKSVRETVKIPFILKGILSVQDVESAKKIGADGIVVSTHAGYAMDYAPAPLEVLPALKKAAGKDLKVIVDSGITRGSDIIKALCLGADFVFLGRLIVWGLLIGGAEGVEWVLKIIREDMERTMALLGVSSIGELSPECLVPLDRMGKNILKNK